MWYAAVERHYWHQWNQPCLTWSEMYHKTSPWNDHCCQLVYRNRRHTTQRTNWIWRKMCKNPTSSAAQQWHRWPNRAQVARNITHPRHKHMQLSGSCYRYTDTCLKEAVFTWLKQRISISTPFSTTISQNMLMENDVTDHHYCCCTTWTRTSSITNPHDTYSLKTQWRHGMQQWNIPICLFY